MHQKALVEIKIGTKIQKIYSALCTSKSDGNVEKSDERRARGKNLLAVTSYFLILKNYGSERSRISCKRAPAVTAAGYLC